MLYAAGAMFPEIFEHPSWKSVPYEILKELSKKNKDQGKLLILFIRVTQLIAVFLLGCSLLFRDKIIFDRDIAIFLASIFLSGTYSYVSEFVIRPSVNDSIGMKRIGAILFIFDLLFLGAWIFSSVLFQKQELIFDLCVGIP
jgi:hypothetical protein